MSTKHLISCGLGIAMIASATAETSAALTNSLENPPYTVGPIHGQDSSQWNSTSGSVGTGNSADIVTSPAAFHGSQSLQIIDGGTGYFDAIRYRLNPANTAVAGPTDDGNASFVFKAAVDPSPSSQSGLSISLLRSDAAGDFTIRRGAVNFQSDGEITWFDHQFSTSTSIGLVGGGPDYVGGRWYLVNVVSHTAGDGDTLTADVTVTDTVTNTLVASATGLVGGNEADRTHWGGLDFGTDSTPPGQWQIDGITFNAPPVPEPGSLALIAIAGAGLIRRRRAAR